MAEHPSPTSYTAGVLIMALGLTIIVAEVSPLRLTQTGSIFGLVAATVLLLSALAWPRRS